MFEALGEIFSRHRGDRRVSFEIELPAEPRVSRLRVRVPTSRARRFASRPVARRSIAEVETESSGTRTSRRALAVRCRCPETLEFEEPIAVLLKEIEALDAAAAHRRARARDRVAAAAASSRCARELYASLTPWQRVLVARHPEPARPRGLHPAAVHRTSSRSTATAASPTTTRS